MRIRHRREAKERAARAAAAARAAQAGADRLSAAVAQMRITRAGSTSKFRAVCSGCQWRGPKRLVPKQAGEDGWQHAQDEAAEFGTYGDGP